MCASNRANNGLATLAGSFSSRGGSSRVARRTGFFSGWETTSFFPHTHTPPPFFSTYFVGIFAPRKPPNPRAAPPGNPSAFFPLREAVREGEWGFFLFSGDADNVTFGVPCGVQPCRGTDGGWLLVCSPPPFPECPTVSRGFTLQFWGDFMPFRPRPMCFNRFSLSSSMRR